MFESLNVYHKVSSECATVTLQLMIHRVRRIFINPSRITNISMVHSRIATFFSADRCRDRVSVGRYSRRPVLQTTDGVSPPQNFLRNEDCDRVADQARVREGAAGAITAERYSRLHCRGGKR